MLHTGLVSTPDQKARAAMYRRYVESVEDLPAFVGSHWFQYYDEPLTGRAGDGENYDIGFVSVTDTPYREMVEAAKAVSSGVYERRSGARGGGALAATRWGGQRYRRGRG
jgi:agarase